MRTILMLVLATTPLPLAAQTAATLVATDGPRFALHSAFWLNLHHFLYLLARAESGHDADRPAIASVLADTAGSAGLTLEQRQGFRAAVDYYREMIADRNLIFDAALVELKAGIAAAGSAPDLSGAAVDAGVARVLQAAAPAYRAVWWTRHDTANRAWVAAALPILERYGETIAAGVTSAFRTRWHATPIRVDVTAHANWSGAYATNGPAHVTISSTADGFAGISGLEMLFHESLHTLDRTLGQALRDTARARGRANAGDVGHAIIFYTAGEVTRRAVGAGYTPYAERFGLWTRPGSTIARYHTLLRTHWQPYLEGRTSFDAAIGAIVGRL